MKKVIFRLVFLGILVAGGWYGYNWYKSRPSRQDSIPTTKVQRGDVVIRAFSRGELRAVRSQILNAPNLNGTVQVTDLAPSGALAKEKDLIVEYDDSERLASLEEQMLSLQSVDESIKSAKASLAIQQSRDQVDLLRAKYNVTRAELDVKKADVTPEIDQKKNRLNLQAAKRALEQQEIDIKARLETAESEMQVFLTNRNRVLQELQRELRRIADTRWLAPITGLVSIRQNRAGNVNFGEQVPEIREGDSLQPGMPVAEILDLSELDVWTRIGELDRANLMIGQEALLQLDAIPDKRFHGKLKAMSGTATTDVYSGDPAKKFDVVFAVDMRELLTGLNMKKADVDRIMATAAANAQKAGTPRPVFSSIAGEGQGGPEGAAAAGGMPMGDRGGEGRQSFARGGEGNQAGGEGRQAGAGGRGGMPNIPQEARTQMTALRTKMESATGAEREKLQKELQALMQKFGMGGRGGQGRGGEGGRGGRGGRTAEVAPFDPVAAAALVRSQQGYLEDERKNAKLPKPPEEDSEVEALLRPGLLADVEIIIEKIPNALHVPKQAVFIKGGKPTVFVKVKKGFEPREVQLVKQSESTVVLAGGVEPGTLVAIMDPTADNSGKKGSSAAKATGGGGAVGALPGGKQ